MANCEVDLRWYWGTGPDTWQGDAGLKSNFGAQLDAAREGRNHVPVPDMGAIEDAAIARCEAANRAANIERRLRCLTRREVMALETHIKGRGLPFGVSSVAVFTEMAKLVTGKQKRPEHERLRAALMDLGNKANKQVEALVFETELLVKDLVAAYEAADVETSDAIPDFRDAGRRERLRGVY